MAATATKTLPATTTSDKSSMLRRGSQSKKLLKEKIVQIYEAFFKVGNVRMGDVFSS